MNITLSNAFTKVYDKFIWGPNATSGGHGSGPGSSLAGTRAVRKYLPQLVEKYNISSMLDAPCGAFTWMPMVLEEIEKTRPYFRYCGYEIVPKLVDSCKQRYGSHKNWNFSLFDITTEPILDRFDIIMARDVFIHLTFEKVKCALNFMSMSGSKYLFTTSYPNDINEDKPDPQFAFNKDKKLNEGAFRAINLLKPPFYFPPPIDCKYDESLISISFYYIVSLYY